MKIHCFQHAPFESPGTILEWAAGKNHTISYTYFFEENYLLPEVNDFDALLIMGGSMNVDEEEKYPWLKIEKQFIKETIDAGKKVMGVCLGSQLIAASQGKRVYKAAEKEIGFFPVQFTSEALLHPLFDHFTNPYFVFQWHGDTFDLPAGAELIASSDTCKHQAFVLGTNVLGLQFHFEMNEPIIEDMLINDDQELDEKGMFISGKEQIRNNYFYLDQNKKDLFVLLDKFLA